MSACRASGRRVVAAVFVEDFSALPLRTGGPTIASYEGGTGRYSIGPYDRNTNPAPYFACGFFENNAVGGNPITNCYVDPASPDGLAAGFDPFTLYVLNNGVLEIRNKRVTNADGSVVPGMEKVAALCPSGGYPEKGLWAGSPPRIRCSRRSRSASSFGYSSRPHQAIGRPDGRLAAIACSIPARA